MTGILEWNPGQGNARQLRIETEQEEDGRWLCEVVDLPGVLAYGETREEAIAWAQVPELRELTDRWILLFA